ncbi:site-specific integrase, partial [Rhizobium leguminosarum]|uniref:site-specific integrase n=1 Tax=Rhizobium leguminosarum TaxID=384 RepID=UPI0013DA0560
MTALALSAPSAALPALVHPSDERTRMRFLEFFTANIRNPNTRKAYARSAADFLHWCEARGVSALPQIQPMHVAAWIEELGRSHAVPTVKQRLAAIRHLFDWMVTGQIMPTNPAHAVRGPSYSTKKGKTPVLSPEEARQLLDSIPTDTIVGLRDRAFIATMTFTFARVGAATGMEVRDVYVQGRRLWVRLHEKGGKVVEMPCHHTLEAYLEEYLEAGGLRDHPKTPLFRTIGRG